MKMSTALAALTLLIPVATISSQPRSMMLVRDRSYTIDLSSVNGFRVLPDGAVLVGDQTEKLLYWVSASGQDSRVIMRKGSGPAELMSFSGLLSLRGDTTLLFDSALRRITVLVGAKVTRTYPIEDAPWKNEFIFPFGVDQSGALYGLRGKSSTVRKGPINPGRLSPYGADSAELIVLAGKSQTARLLGTVKGGYAPSRMVKKTVNGMTIFYQLMALFERGDAVAVCNDGVIFRAGAMDGRVWWWQNGKQQAVESPLFDRPPVTEERKRLAIEQSQSKELAKYFKSSEYPDWAKRVPAFADRSAWCLSTGDALASSDPDRDGMTRHYFVRRNGGVTLLQGAPRHAKIIGVGAASGVYFAVESEDGLWAIERFQIRQ